MIGDGIDETPTLKCPPLPIDFQEFEFVVRIILVSSDVPLTAVESTLELSYGQDESTPWILAIENLEACVSRKIRKNRHVAVLTSAVSWPVDSGP